MNNIDKFLDRVPKANYNCLDFVREVWLDWYGEDVTDRLKKLVGAFVGRRVTISGVKAFKRLQHPVSPCFFVMQRQRCTPHVGIYYEGRMLHLGAKGAEYQLPSIVKSYFKTVRYYL